MRTEVYNLSQGAGRSDMASVLYTIALAYLLVLATCAPLDMKSNSPVTSWRGMARQTNLRNGPISSLKNANNNNYYPTKKHPSYQTGVGDNWFAFIRAQNNYNSVTSQAANNDLFRNQNKFKDETAIASFGPGRFSESGLHVSNNQNWEDLSRLKRNGRLQYVNPLRNNWSRPARLSYPYRSSYVPRSKRFRTTNYGTLREFRELMQSHGKGDLNSRWG